LIESIWLLFVDVVGGEFQNGISQFKRVNVRLKLFEEHLSNQVDFLKQQSLLRLQYLLHYLGKEPCVYFEFITFEETLSGLNQYILINRILI